MKQETVIPEKVQIIIDKTIVTAKGPAGETKRIFPVLFKIEQGRAVFQTPKNRNEKKLINTFKAHLKNMIRGVQKKYAYKLKICASHFPIQASTTSTQFIVKNFVGEKNPRIMQIPPGVTITIKEQDITVESCDIELAGRTAGQMELLTRVSNKDRRIFQDGIYITEKAL